MALQNRGIAIVTKGLDWYGDVFPLGPQADTPNIWSADWEGNWWTTLMENDLHEL
jgi:hypothetical protein